MNMLQTSSTEEHEQAMDATTEPASQSDPKPLKPSKYRRRRENLKKRMMCQQGNCWYCGTSLNATNATFEHILPRSRGGTRHKKNIRMACRTCNQKKGDTPLEYVVLKLPASCRQKPKLLFTWELEATESESRMREATVFQYDTLPETHRANAQAHAMKVHESLNQKAHAVIDIGNRLYVLKKKIGAAHFKNWFKAEFGWSRPIAENYMRIAQKFSELSCIGQFQISALHVLVHEQAPEQAVQIAIDLAMTGKPITIRVAHDIVRKIEKLEKKRNQVSSKSFATA